MEDVGVGAIVFGYLLNSRIKDISFDLQEALNSTATPAPMPNTPSAHLQRL